MSLIQTHDNNIVRIAIPQILYNIRHSLQYKYNNWIVSSANNYIRECLQKEDRLDEYEYIINEYESGFLYTQKSIIVGICVWMKDVSFHTTKYITSDTLDIIYLHYNNDTIMQQMKKDYVYAIHKERCVETDYDFFDL
jgi:hypothetical protein